MTTMSDIKMLNTLFNSCLDILRDNEHLTGEKALRVLSHLLILKLMEPQFGTSIDIDNYPYDFSEYGNSINIDKHRADLLNVVRFSNLTAEKEANLPVVLKFLWSDILSVHPVTKNVYLPGQGFNITNASTCRKLITKLNSFDFKGIDEDILGEAYEEIIKESMKGKVLGQFFTPPVIKQLMVNMINPQLKSDGTIETIFDPSMGTGGFLITAMRHIHRQSIERKIDIDWKFISSSGIGGKEVEGDTYQLAVSNMLISTGHMFDNLLKGDSIRDPITGKYDIILANPPFGINGLNYNEIKHVLKNEYIPIKSNSAIPLFLQAIIYMLKIGGRCAVILPDGKELYGKSKDLFNIRQYLMATCDLTDVIYLPVNTFNHTAIKTCILKFVKKVECSQAMSTHIKISKKTKNEISRTHTFSVSQTKQVKFSKYVEGVVATLAEVPMSIIAGKDYSLQYNNYLLDAKLPEGYKFLGDLCTFQKGSMLSKSKITVGQFPVIGGGGKPTGYHNVSNREANTILCSSSGSAGLVSRYTVPIWASDCFSIHTKDPLILSEDYLYPYLKGIQEDIYKLRTGVAIPHIYAKTLERLIVKLLPLEQQVNKIEQHVAMCCKRDDMLKQVSQIDIDIKTLFTM